MHIRDAEPGTEIHYTGSITALTSRGSLLMASATTETVSLDASIPGKPSENHQVRCNSVLTSLDNVDADIFDSNFDLLLHEA